MRILHVTDAVSPVGGAQTHLHGLVEMLATAGHDVVVLHNEPGGAAPSRVRQEEYEAAGVRTRLAAFAPDVVHVHGPTLPPHLESMLREFPVIHSLHDFAFACSSGSKYYRDGEICLRAHGLGCLAAGLPRGCSHRVDLRPFVGEYRRIRRSLPMLRRASAVVVHSRYIRSVALANGLTSEALKLIPYSVVRPAELQPRPEMRTLAFAGRVVPDKGLDVLIDALASIQGSWDRLSVAGDGWDRARCSRLASSRGISSKVEFLGHLGAAEVRREFERARVVVVPSRWPEPFGIVGLEAMAAGRPVVATNVGGIPEWLEDGRTGVLVRPGDAHALADALGAVLADPDRGEEMGNEGWRDVARFSPKNHLQQLLSVYRAAAIAPDGALADTGVA